MIFLLAEPISTQFVNRLTPFVLCWCLLLRVEVSGWYAVYNIRFPIVPFVLGNGHCRFLGFLDSGQTSNFTCAEFTCNLNEVEQ